MQIVDRQQIRVGRIVYAIAPQDAHKIDETQSQSKEKNQQHMYILSNEGT